MLLDPKIPGKIARFETTYEPLRYRSLGFFKAEVAETLEHYRSVPTDLQVDWKPVEEGDTWGDNWNSAWVRASITIPQGLEGKKLYVRAVTGAPESQFYVDGVHRGVFDVNHPVRLLDLEAKSSYEVHFEAYAGHTFPGTQPFEGIRSADGAAHVTPGCRAFGSIELVDQRDDVSEFIFELRALRQVAQSLDENSLRRAEIFHAFEEIFKVVYAKPEEVDESTWRPPLVFARKIMQPLLAKKNGPTTPLMSVIGHSHIDTAWLWPIGETWRKCARTFSSVLALMDEYPEFRFTSSAALHMDKMRVLYPAIFARVQERVKEGRWEINGAMWIEPDCNIPSGESFVRQCLLGQRATREMFGVTSDTLWQPDVFGYSAALPQILQKSGVEFFCTTKLSWNDTNRFPYDTFHWQGIDGTTVLAHFNEMQGWVDPERLATLWNDVRHKDVQDRRLVGFGHGDGGGGPMAEMIEMVALSKDLEGCPKAEYANISEFMVGARDALTSLPKWVGELYLELHRGTLTSIAAIKRYNRRCEFALKDAELAATIAKLRRGAEYPAAELTESWKEVLLNQFHDILPGSSIAEVNDGAIATYVRCLDRTLAVRDAALGDGPNVSLLNSLSWERDGEMVVRGWPVGRQPEGGVAQEFVDVFGKARTALSGVSLPSLGNLSVATVPLESLPSGFKASSDEVETPFARVRFGEDGQIVSFFDIHTERELVSSGGAFNQFWMGEDVPAGWDNWDIDRDQRHKMVAQKGLFSRQVSSDGPLQLRIRQEFKLGHSSSLVQDIVFHSTTARVDFETRVDWHEKYQFLKVGFTPDILADTARHEIQFGHVVRNAHDNTSMDRAQFDVCAHKWTAVSEADFGIVFLNDCKYGCTFKDGDYRLSLIKSGRHPDPRGDEGVHAFSYAVLPYASGFSVPSVVRPAYEFNVEPVVFGHPTEAFSLVSVDAPNVIVESVKWAEDGDGFVVRLYEAGRTGAFATLTFGVEVKSIEETDVLEENPVPVRERMYFRPFEIKTLRCRV